MNLKWYKFTGWIFIVIGIIFSLSIAIIAFPQNYKLFSSNFLLDILISFSIPLIFSMILGLTYLRLGKEKMRETWFSRISLISTLLYVIVLLLYCILVFSLVITSRDLEGAIWSFAIFILPSSLLYVLSIVLLIINWFIVRNK